MLGILQHLDHKSPDKLASGCAQRTGRARFQSSGIDFIGAFDSCRPDRLCQEIGWCLEKKGKDVDHVGGGVVIDDILDAAQNCN